MRLNIPTTEKGVKIYYVTADKSKGFNFGYFIRVECEDQSKPLQLIGEGNNCGSCDGKWKAVVKTIKDSIMRGSAVSRQIQSKIKNSVSIIPCFPRPSRYVDGVLTLTHALTSQTMELKGDMERFDEQYLAMIEHAKQELTGRGYTTTEQVLMVGFSGSGQFARRFSFLHPEVVSGVITGGSDVPCLPVTHCDGQELKYPLGAADYENLTGNVFDFNAYRRIPQFFYLGDKDQNDPAQEQYLECYTEEEIKTIRSVYNGNNMQERWSGMCEIIDQLGLDNIHPHLIIGAAHDKICVDEMIRQVSEHLCELVSPDNIRHEQCDNL